MYLKNDRYFKVKALTNADTDTLELQEEGLVSAIKLDFEAVLASGAQNNNKARIIDHITSIEVTNGGTDIMFSLTGQEVKALDWYLLRKVQPETAPLYGGFTNRTSVTIPFGRYIGDPKYALDLGAFDEVDLEITNDATTSNWAAAALKVDVHVMTLKDLAAKPAKYFKHYEWRNNAPSAAGQYVYHDLPKKDPIAAVMCQIDPTILTAGNTTNNENADANNIKMTFKNETEVVWDHRPKDVFRDNAAIYGKVQTQARYFPSTTQYIDTGIGYVTGLVYGNGNFTSGDALTTPPVIDDINLRFVKFGSIGTAAGSTDSAFADLIAEGVGYYDTMMLWDTLQQEESQHLDPTNAGKGPVRLAWYGSQTDHKFRTCLTTPLPQGRV